ncbi:uncharacterized protein BXZ73DRAFT_83212 [Epithele typhae]|uniref:uncharacterized protein n=1 Tax=Epithele typhae TaxID=378194 RepID=UPI002008623B|nr:uncharacterized protein BXZ73DRAFT_83212 [Epithele typhae]KAH9910765.1 hypothetical protein BXZ73DRAFT_83212 [Epithele typhae]
MPLANPQQARVLNTTTSQTYYTKDGHRRTKKRKIDPGPPVYASAGGSEDYRSGASRVPDPTPQSDARDDGTAWEMPEVTQLGPSEKKSKYKAIKQVTMHEEWLPLAPTFLLRLFAARSVGPFWRLDPEPHGSDPLEELEPQLQLRLIRATRATWASNESDTEVGDTGGGGQRGWRWRTGAEDAGRRATRAEMGDAERATREHYVGEMGEGERGEAVGEGEVGEVDEDDAGPTQTQTMRMTWALAGDAGQGEMNQVGDTGNAGDVGEADEADMGKMGDTDEIKMGDEGETGENE